MLLRNHAPMQLGLGYEPPKKKQLPGTVPCSPVPGQLKANSGRSIDGKVEKKRRAPSLVRCDQLFLVGSRRAEIPKDFFSVSKMHPRKQRKVRLARLVGVSLRN